MTSELTHPFRCTLIMEPLYNERGIKASLLRPVSGYSSRRIGPYRFAFSSWQEIRQHWESEQNASLELDLPL